MSKRGESKRPRLLRRTERSSRGLRSYFSTTRMGSEPLGLKLFVWGPAVGQHAFRLAIYSRNDWRGRVKAFLPQGGLQEKKSEEAMTARASVSPHQMPYTP